MAVRVGRFELRDPQRLFLTVIALAILVALMVRCSRQGTIRKVISVEEESSITTYTTNVEEAEKGTVKLVGTSTIDALPSQLSIYLASMLMTNLHNVDNGMAQQMANALTVDTEYDKDRYRYVVAINPAHGGPDKGEVNGDLQEKDITLEVARTMIDYLNLNNNGFYFFLTRGSDVNMTEQQRLTLIQAYEADLVITIHVNASELEAGGTMGTYWDDSLNEKTTNKLDFTRMEEDEEEEEVDMTRTDESQELAAKLMEAAADGLGMWFRWTEVENSPTTKLEVPAVNIYLGYISYFFDYNCLMNQEGRQQAGLKMGEALLAYLETVAPYKSPMELQIDQMNGGSNSSGN